MTEFEVESYKIICVRDCGTFSSVPILSILVINASLYAFYRPNSHGMCGRHEKRIYILNFNRNDKHTGNFAVTQPRRNLAQIYMFYLSKQLQLQVFSVGSY